MFIHLLFAPFSDYPARNKKRMDVCITKPIQEPSPPVTHGLMTPPAKLVESMNEPGFNALSFSKESDSTLGTYYLTSNEHS